MTHPYGTVASAYSAFKGVIFAPASKEALSQLIGYLQHSGGAPELLAEAQCYFDAPHELEFDFNRMCIGPYKLTVPPYESVYLSHHRELFTEETDRVADWYQELGLIPDGGLNEPADFIGHELEFLYCLHALKSEYTKQGREDANIELDRMANEFMQQHLGKWYQAFTSDMEREAKLNFWRLYAIALRQFLSSQLTH